MIRSFLMKEALIHTEAPLVLRTLPVIEMDDRELFFEFCS